LGDCFVAKKTLLAMTSADCFVAKNAPRNDEHNYSFMLITFV